MEPQPAPEEASGAFLWQHALGIQKGLRFSSLEGCLTPAPQSRVNRDLWAQCGSENLGVQKDGLGGGRRKAGYQLW